MSDIFDRAKQKATDLIASNSKRVLTCQAMEDLYFMVWPEETLITKQMENVKITRSPRARNDIKGTHRLMVSTSPIIAVPYDTNSATMKAKANAIEPFLKAMLMISGVIAGKPIHNDAVLSALMYGETIIAINSTKEMVTAATSPGLKRRALSINQRTPYVLEVLNPKYCNIERSHFGLTAFHQTKKVTALTLIERFGKSAEDALGKTKSGRKIESDTELTYHDLIDLDNRVVWVEESDTPILVIENKLPFIPVAAHITEGSALFEDEDQRREPFLWTVSEGKLMDRENLFLTVLSTLAFALGAAPMYADYTNDPAHAPQPDYSEVGGTLHYRINERREALVKNVIDPSLMQLWQTITQLEEESTIYKQALGQPLGGDTPYSTVALLNQAGRLPLVMYVDQVGRALAEALEITLQWIRVNRRQETVIFQNSYASLKPSDIQQYVMVDVKLKVDLPQDQLQAANAANVLANGDDPLVSKEWVRENVLHIGQSDVMQKQIYDERAFALNYQMAAQKKMFEMQMQIQAMQAQMQMQMQQNQLAAQPAQAPTEAGYVQGGNPPQPIDRGAGAPMTPAEPLPPVAPPNMQPGAPPVEQG